MTCTACNGTGILPFFAPKAFANAYCPACRCSCGHPADRIFEWAPGHLGDLLCDCCLKKVWKETLRNVTESLAGLKVRCPAQKEAPDG